MGVWGGNPVKPLLLYLEDKLYLCSVLSKLTGKTASLYETCHVDWIPTQNLGYSTAKVTNVDLSRNKKAGNRAINGQDLKKLQRTACTLKDNVIKWKVKDETRAVKLISTLAISGTCNG